MMTVTVAYQGVPGSFSYLAAEQYFGNSCMALGADRFEILFKMVHDEDATHAVIPIENSLAGSVFENFDLLNRYPVAITGEHYSRVKHNLLALKAPGAKGAERLTRIKRVFSHPKAFEQCVRFLEEHPWMEKTIYSDTGSAARHVFDQQDPTIAAIASAEAAALYQLEVLQDRLEDNPDNYTRFFIIEKKMNIPANADKASLLFTLSHEPGSLYAAMEVLARNKLNLTKIESRPIHGKPFQYSFHIDFEFPVGSLEKVRSVLEEFKRHTVDLRVLGYYRAGKTP